MSPTFAPVSLQVGRFPSVFLGMTIRFLLPDEAPRKGFRRDAKNPLTSAFYREGTFKMTDKFDIIETVSNTIIERL
ncbi:MAG: hypothetical protein J6L82_01630, partial [Alphaproteobacteria bacterium]|nr:hypothetical protein [Alphaproteobacteria bacterium]